MCDIEHTSFYLFCLLCATIFLCRISGTNHVSCRGYVNLFLQPVSKGNLDDIAVLENAVQNQPLFYFEYHCVLWPLLKVLYGYSIKMNIFTELSVYVLLIFIGMQLSSITPVYLPEYLLNRKPSRNRRNRRHF